MKRAIAFYSDKRYQPRTIPLKNSEVNFKCRGCGACCRIKNGIVRVGDGEIKRIAAFLGMSEQEFIDRETEIAPDRKGLILKSRADESCVYLTEENRCRIHPVKPDKCRTFPFEWANPDSAEVCPALNFPAEKTEGWSH